jgi:ribonuclease P protein component
VRATFVPVDEGVSGIYPQVGYAIGRNCGNAVVRNGLRRRMREAVRAAAPDLPRGTYLLRVDRAAATSEPAQFTASVSEALRRASRPAGMRP